MSNLRIFHDLDTADATLSSTPTAVTTMPIGNLLLPGRGRKARWLDTSVSIDITWPSGRIVDSIALVRCNLTSSATWRARLWFDIGKTLLVADLGVGPVYPRLGWGEFRWGVDPIGASIYDGWPLKFGVQTFDATGAQAMTIEIDDPDNPDGFVEISRLIAGLSYSPSHHANAPKVVWRDDAKQTRTSGGSLVTVSALEPYRRAEMDYSSLTLNDRAALMELARRIGGRRDVFVLCWDAARDSRLLRDGAIHAKFVSVPEPIHKARDAFDVATFALEEC